MQYSTKQAQAADQKRREAEAQFKVAQQATKEATLNLAEAGLGLKRADVRLTSATSNELFITGQPFKALLKGLEAGNKLKQLSPSAGAVDNTQMVTTVALHQAVYAVQERNSLEKHQSSVLSVSFSPDGKTLASASEDNTVKLWDVASGKQTKSLSGHESYVLSVSFSPDGKTLASASWDNTVKLWDFDLDRLMALGCAWVHDYLTTNPKAPDSATVRQACDSITGKK